MYSAFYNVHCFKAALQKNITLMFIIPSWIRRTELGDNIVDTCDVVSLYVAILHVYLFMHVYIFRNPTFYRELCDIVNVLGRNKVKCVVRVERCQYWRRNLTTLFQTRGEDRFAPFSSNKPCYSYLVTPSDQSQVVTYEWIRWKMIPCIT